VKKRFLFLLLPIITLILEILPYGAVCVFASSPTDVVINTYSYFSMVPFGYANFSPLLTAFLTCTVLVLLTVYFVKGNRVILRATNYFLIFAAVISLGSLIYGIKFYSLVASLITFSLIAEFVILQISIKKS
jgi:hypothetical protein